MEDAIMENTIIENTSESENISTTASTSTTISTTTSIKDIVLSSCGPNLVTMLGVLHELHNQDFFNLENIESFYASSGGTIIAVLILLGEDFETIKNYIIKRPWNTVWQIDPNSIFYMYQNMGLFNVDDFYKGFEPFFLAKNIERNITLAEFYEITKKTLYFYITELNEFDVFYANHETHPNMKLIEAMYMSSSVPGIFTPIIRDDKCFIDGGLMNYFPINDILRSCTDTDSILGLCNKRNIKYNNITSESNILEFFITLIFKNVDYIINNANTNTNDINTLKNIIYVPGFDSNNLWLEMLNSEEKRAEMYELGMKTAREFLEKKKEEKREKEKREEEKREKEKRENEKREKEGV